MDIFSYRTDSSLAHAAAFFLGVFLHSILFRFGEWDLQVPKVLFILISTYFALIYCFVFYTPPDSNHLSVCVINASNLVLVLMGGIYTSTVVYRIFFHPLRRFPGPFLARISSAYATGLLIKKYHPYKEIQRLHQVYGDIVRLGPSELSISSSQALQAIYSSRSPCIKGMWYNLLLPLVSVHTARDAKDHARRRKVWDKGFGAKALRNYEPRVSQYTDLLLSQIHAREGKIMDITLWCNFYGFDVMGDLAFAKSFNMLKDGVKHDHMVNMHKNMILSTSFGRFPWAFLLLQHVPILNLTYKRFLNWLKGEVTERMEREPELPDVFSGLLDEYKRNPQPSYQETLDLYGDANLIVVAGSDTTSASLTCILFELATHPQACVKLQKELDEYFSQHETPEHMSLSKLQYLQAVIDEAMRLYPAVPSGLQRMTPPEGLFIGETFIPGDMTVQVPTYTLFRDPRCFERPDEFIPERWTTQPDLVKDGTVFTPFSIDCGGISGRVGGWVHAALSEAGRRVHVKA
ncbi:hypothetical protein AK830_g4686 [Neonectria ditissima]|uniref:Tryprostatin B 6-hydroxylase n=1 Tax=Neonectria ditissima TaxID=78410 RepID=A0A0P7BKJ5_9HYPO|nr:hypothetical protein AK830_g4686 [Neonectria ditissima]